MASNDVKALIEQRASDLADGFRAADVDKLMSFFSEDVDFSDIAMSVYNLNHASLRAFYDMMLALCTGMTITNVTVSGPTPDFVAWEMDLGFVMKTDEEHLGVKAGQKVLMQGVAVQWWRQEEEEEGGEGKWKIWKERDYFTLKK